MKKIFSIIILIFLTNNVSFSQEKPNIILLLSDDQGYGDIGRHGHPFLKTPNMDRLHDESIRMTDFSVSSTCAPTRASIMTGMQEFNSGVTSTWAKRRLMNLDITILPQLMKKAGYSTGHFGKWHLGDPKGYLPYDRGFDHGVTIKNDNQKTHYNPTLLSNDTLIETKGYRTDVFFNEAINWIKKQDDKPFFCYLPTYNAHGPHVVPDKYAKPYKNIKNVDESTAKFFGMLANLDENIGRLLEELETMNIAKNTIFIFMNDNGATAGVDSYNAGMRGCKGTVWRGGTRAFSFWRWPEHWKPRDDNALSAHVDLLPTLVELAGGQLPKEVAKKIEGISLAKRLYNPEAKWPDRMLFQHVGRWSDGLAEAHRHSNSSVRWGKWHLIHTENIKECTKECKVTRKAYEGTGAYYTRFPEEHRRLSPSAEWELFNMEVDLHEDQDIANNHPKVVKKMASAYEEWWEKVRPLMINENE